ncbi:hypothetical protein [Natranaeroarchaeum sulfidigenes]|uniref:Putative membrane protein n=1 Tax=Natranaeroarchaeum sulfidigenes TaxID=2784880 RepID=A0A897MTE6_9EURY|nr:hypothetical protein [Natranaeroarchaeum sulfidigenes]QSG03308.1 putative membrane protein [Natranaeroarchaeum sulfidigenes]
MFRRARENGPALLVPLAWTFVTAVHLDLASEHALLIAHLVMATIIAGFTLLSWGEMTEGVLLLWRRVLLVGFLITLAGIVGFAVDSLAALLFTASLIGWMIVPGVALVATGRQVQLAPRPYVIGGVLSLAGAAVYAAGPLIGGGVWLSVFCLTLVNIGQTAGIVNAVHRY